MDLELMLVLSILDLIKRKLNKRGQIQSVIIQHIAGDKIKEAQKINLGINHFTKVFKL
jgi:hypothetical protein